MRRLLPILLALTAAGCGGPTPLREPDRTVAITISDFRFTPQAVRVRHGRVTFSARNDGRLPHNFELRGRGSKRLRISTLLPGESGQATVKLPRGSYRMYCAVSNHEELGQYGSVEVN